MGNSTIKMITDNKKFKNVDGVFLGEFDNYTYIQQLNSVVHVATGIVITNSGTVNDIYVAEEIAFTLDNMCEFKTVNEYRALSDNMRKDMQTVISEILEA